MWLDFSSRKRSPRVSILKTAPCEGREGVAKKKKKRLEEEEERENTKQSLHWKVKNETLESLSRRGGPV